MKRLSYLVMSQTDAKPMSEKEYNAQYQEALQPFRQMRYEEALLAFRKLFPHAPQAKAQASILRNIAICLVESAEENPWEEMVAVMERYAEFLRDPSAHAWPTPPAVDGFQAFVRCGHLHALEGAQEYFARYAQALPERYFEAFLEGVVQAFEQEAISYGQEGHDTRALCIGRLYLELTGMEPPWTKTRSAIRNRMANMMLFLLPHENQKTDRSGLQPQEQEARALLLQTLQEDPDNVFALELKTHIEQRGQFRMQLARFWHDIRNRIAPIKVAAERLRALPELTEEARQWTRSIESHITMIDTALRVSGAGHGSQAVGQPDCESFVSMDPAKLCQECLEEKGISTGKVVTVGAARSWEISPGYVRLVLENLLSNTLEAYGRRGITPPDPSVELIVSYQEGTILLRDWAGGISPELSDPFAPYASTKDAIHMGSGLGLAQARSAIEQHDGTLSLASPQPDDGAAFVIRFKEF